MIATSTEPDLKALIRDIWDEAHDAPELKADGFHTRDALACHDALNKIVKMIDDTYSAAAEK